jgi:AraC-like DNA-binding protein
MRCAPRPDFSAQAPDGPFPIRFFVRNRPERQGPYVPAPHVHDCLELGFCHEGAGVFVIGDKSLPFGQRDLVVVNSSEPHYGQNAPGVESVWSWLFFDPVALLGPTCDTPAILDTSRLCGPSFRNVVSPRAQPGLDTLVALVLAEERAKRAGYQSAIRGVLVALMARLHRLPGQSTADRAAPLDTRSAERLSPALDIIRSRYAEPIRIAHLARACNMSDVHFRARFKQVWGRSVYQFVLAHRVSMAMAELRRGVKTVDMVAMESGFPSLSSFLRKFRDVTGKSPRAWAKTNT